MRVSSYPRLVIVVWVNEYRTTNVTRVLKIPTVELSQNVSGERIKKNFGSITVSRVFNEQIQSVNNRSYVFRLSEALSVWLALTNKHEMMSPGSSKHQVLCLAKMLVVIKLNNVLFSSVFSRMLNE